MSDTLAGRGELEQIKSLATDFRQLQKSGKSPQLENFLDKVHPEGREILFQNLLQLDMLFRRRRGEEPESSEYLQRFPKYRRLVREAFFESTQMSIEVGERSASSLDQETMAFNELPTQRYGEYEIIRELGRGGFGVVYEAQHARRQNRVALKTLPVKSDSKEFNAERLHKFRREFRMLSEMNHPNLVGMQTLEVDGDQWFFTMDLIDGRDFLDYVRPHNADRENHSAENPLSEERLRHTLGQLVRGVVALHEKRIVHRDLKPNNVLVKSDGTVVILDFGLIAQLQKSTDQTASLRSEMFAGTPRYAAPEQMFGDRSEASDWYAVGTMLYEALCGKSPFTGSSMELLKKKQSEDPPLLENHTEFPRDLARLADSMIRRDPASRPPADDILEFLGLDLESRTTSSSSQGSTRGGSLSSLTRRKSSSQGDSLSSGIDEMDFDDSMDGDQFLIGRDNQLAELQAIGEALLENRFPAVCFIKGLSGEGKSSLAEKFLHPYRVDKSMLVLSGRCYDRESVPYKVIDSQIDSLVRYLHKLPNDELESLIPDDIQMLAHLFPLLRRVKPIDVRCHANLKAIDIRQIRYRGFAAMKELLCNIGRSMPIVMFVDDLQWGDADSVEVMANLLSPPHPPPILFLGSYRSDEAAESPFLNDWHAELDKSEAKLETQEVLVDALSEADCYQYLVNRFGDESEKIRGAAAELFQSTKGNPYFLEQLAEGVNPETGKLDPIPLDQIIDSRLATCPRAAGDLLDAIAVAGKAVSIAESATVAGLADQAWEIVNHMRSERLVRLIGSEEDQLVDTYHDKIRETVLEQMSSKKRMSQHLRYAQTIESQEAANAVELHEMLQQNTEAADSEICVNRVFDLAHHYSSSKDKRAFVYLVLAAERSKQTYAVEEALEYYEKLKDGMDARDFDSLRYRIFVGKGITHQWNCETRKSRDCFLNAKCATTDSKSLGRVFSLLSKLSVQAGNFKESIDWLDKSLKEFGRKRLKFAFSKIAFSIWQLGKLACFPRWVEGSSHNNENLVGLSEALSDNFHVVETGFCDYMEIISLSSIVSVKTGIAREVARGYAEAAFLLSALGLHKVAIKFLSRSEKIINDDSDVEFQGYMSYTRGLIHYWSGNLKAANREYDVAINCLEKCYSQTNLRVSLHMKRHVLFYNSTSNAELGQAKKVLKVAKATQNREGICWGNYDMASSLARLGDFNDAARHILDANRMLESERYLMTESICAAVSAYALLQMGNYSKAHDLAATSYRIALKNFILLDVNLLCLPIVVESLLGSGWNKLEPDRDRKKLRRLLRRNFLFYFVVPNNQPHMTRVAGRAAAAMGKNRKAVRHFTKAIKLCEKKGMKYQQAKSLLDLAAVQEENRQANRAEAIRLLKEMESVIPRAESWLLGDQRDDSVIAPEFDLAAWESENGPITPYLDTLRD